jgi:hypothetical protein
MPHRIHPKLPEGFAYADRLQVASYEATGSVNGAAKVVLVAVDPRALEAAGPDEYPSDYFDYLAKVTPPALACRLRPPRRWEDIVSPVGRKGVNGPAGRDWYIEEYNNGWACARRGSEDNPFSRGTSSHAFDDGYLDAASGRMKWHLTYCADHDNCGEG